MIATAFRENTQSSPNFNFPFLATGRRAQWIGGFLHYTRGVEPCQDISSVALFPAPFNFWPILFVAVVTIHRQNPLRINKPEVLLRGKARKDTPLCRLRLPLLLAGSPVLPGSHGWLDINNAGTITTRREGPAEHVVSALPAGKAAWGADAVGGRSLCCPLAGVCGTLLLIAEALLPINILPATSSILDIAPLTSCRRLLHSPLPTSRSRLCGQNVFASREL